MSRHLLQQVVFAIHVWFYLFVSISTNVRPNVRERGDAAGYFGMGDSKRDPWLSVPLVARPWLPADSTPWDMSCTTDFEYIDNNQLPHLYTRETSNRFFIPTYSCCLFNRFRNRLYDKMQAFVRTWFFRGRNESAVWCERPQIQLLIEPSRLNWNCMRNLIKNLKRNEMINSCPIFNMLNESPHL